MPEQTRNQKPATAFNGQWVEIFATGSHTDNEGRAHSITKDFLNQAVANFNSEEHEPPIVIGHLAENAPAFGWARGLRVNGDRLEAQFGDVNPEFESMVKDGAFKKRSASFYLRDGKPALRHVGFLGATPPAVKGLKDIQFADGEAQTFDCDLRTADFSEGDETMKDEDVTTITERVFGKLKEMFGGKPAEAASFSEADTKKLVAESVKAATASFADEIKTRDTKIELLEKAVNAQASKTTRAEIIAFVEKQGNASLPPALRTGLAEFMETLDGGTADGSRKVTVIEFTEENGVKKETKSEFSQLGYFRQFIESLPAFIQFGESFGSLRATGTDNGSVVPESRMAELRAKGGLPAATTK